MMGKVVITCMILILFGCQSALKKVGVLHEKGAGDWIALSQYAKYNLAQYGVTITAQLISEELRSGEQSYQVTNIKLSRAVDEYNLDLLAPNFEGKLICKPKCEFLNEYIVSGNEGGYTLLSRFFKENEYELFSFYGELFKLNEKLSQLESQQELLITGYLENITSRTHGFVTLNDFIQDLKFKLSEEAIVNFSKEPINIFADKNIQYRNYLRKVDKTGNYKQSQEEGDWIVEVEGNLPETKLWDTSLSISEKDLWGTELMNNNGIDSSDSWITAKNTSIIKGNQVCSFENNFFGTAIEIANDVITVQLFGQAKVVNDGITTTPESGYLFNTSEVISFMPIIEIESFSLIDFAVCTYQ